MKILAAISRAIFGTPPKFPDPELEAQGWVRSEPVPGYLCYWPPPPPLPTPTPKSSPEQCKTEINLIN